MAHEATPSTRERIIAAARPLFLELGFEGTSVSAICRDSGVSNGSVFHHFPAKEDIAFAVYSDVRIEYWDRIIGAMIACEEPLDGIETAVRAAFSFQRENPGAAAFLTDVTGSKWIETYAGAAKTVYDAGMNRALAWAIPHIQAGRLPFVSPDAFIALVGGAPQWIGRVIRIGFASSTLDAVEGELGKMVRKAFTP